MTHVQIKKSLKYHGLEPYKGYQLPQTKTPSSVRLLTPHQVLILAHFLTARFDLLDFEIQTLCKTNDIDYDLVYEELEESIYSSLSASIVSFAHEAGLTEPVTQ